MLHKVYFLLVLFVVGCQTIPSAGVPEADDSPIQLLKTSLQITVRDKLGNVVEGAKVQIFKNKEDYQQEANAVGGVAYSDEKGRVRYIDLEPMEYYVNVEKDDMNNYGAGIKTDELSKNRTNKVTIIIE